MTVTATISIPSDAFELGEILAMEAGISIELTQFVPVDDGLIPYFWASDGDLREFENEVRADSRVKSLTGLDSAVDSTLYQIEWHDSVDGFLGALIEHDVMVESATGTADEWTFHLRTHDSDALSRFHSVCHEN
ncbi:MAG TPA: bacterio-opsin activator domain-containing protein, partial [Halococcus sp.]|nr:bacterio-opsin activator domain-containing protein [Halococcus sp.]